jgi:hypothetical protein
MNNEPVAWMDDFGNVFEMKNKFFYIPLYTHPAKTLTDEEILDVERRLRNNGDFCELHFAKAILRKAQEK